MTLTAFSRHLVALAGLGAIFAAQAESTLSSGAAAGLAASARLEFRVVVPTILFMQVDTGTNFANNATIDLVDFNVPTADVGTGNPTPGLSSAPVTARVVTNGNSVSLTARGSAGGLTNGAQSIPWSQIMAAAGGSLPHPAIGDGVAGAASTLVASAGVLDRSSTWSFSYRNSNTLPAGNYGGQVTYTAALP